MTERPRVLLLPSPTPMYLRGHGRTVCQRELHDAVPVVLEAPHVGIRRRWLRRRVGVDTGGVEPSACLVWVPGAFIGAPSRLPMLFVVGASRPTPALLVTAVVVLVVMTRYAASKRAKGTTHSMLRLTFF